MTTIDQTEHPFATSRERMVTLAATLVVTTLMVAITAYVLSFALLGDWRMGSNMNSHRAAYAALHAHS